MGAHRHGQGRHLPSLARGDNCPPLENVKVRFTSITTFLFAQTKTVATKHVSPTQTAFVAGAPRWVWGAYSVLADHLVGLKGSPLRQRGERMAERGKRKEEIRKQGREKESEVWRGKGCVDFAHPCKNSCGRP